MKIESELFEKVSEENLVNVDLDITSFMGGLDAEHYYGELTFWGSDHEILYQLEVKRLMTLKEAKYLDDKNTSHGRYQRAWRRGDKETVKFNSEADLVGASFDVCGEISTKIKFGFNLKIKI